MKGRALMVQGCSSGAGKSYLTAALCRLYARRGLRVAPFKAQNMSNNAGVTPAGLEMGRAQLVQARAARVTPDVRMNPVLIKPEGDTHSQVVVLGEPDAAVAALPWTARKAQLWPVVARSLHSLLDEFELVVIEGAGSPAEVNLKAGDIVNMRVAREAQARVLLAADIDRGGAFAHLLGTWSCLEAAERQLLLGFVLNKFRGDPALLGDGLSWLEARTGVPTLGVVPYLPLALPDEDAHDLAAFSSGGALEVALIRFPTASNLDEFGALEAEAQVSLRWVSTPAALSGAKLIILPGSKHVAADGAWLGRTGLAAAIRERASAGVTVLGICGGLQLLGHRVDDPHGAEGGAGPSSTAGLGLLDLTTTLETQKVTRLTRTTLLPSGAAVAGYEIHHGRTQAGPDATPYLADNLGFRQANVSGVYLHDLFADTAFRTSVLGELGVQADPSDWNTRLETTLDALADHVGANLELDALDDALFGSASSQPTQTRRGTLIFVTGGARSGKSRYAEALVTRALGEGETALYLATLAAGDPEMVRRVARHQAQRPTSWRTLETPLDPAAALESSAERVVLLDCLSGFVSNLLLAAAPEAIPEAATAASSSLDQQVLDEEPLTEAVLEAVETLLTTVRRTSKTVVIVTNEVGSGVVPAYPLGRLYRDALGLANARVAAAADAAVLCTAGLPQVLKGTLPEVSRD